MENPVSITSHRLLLYLILFFLPLSAQIQIHRSLTVEDGLLQSQITALHEDRNGYLWIGSLGGLTRWDGLHYTNFSTEDGLAAASVVSIAESGDGTMYFGTYGGGLSIYEDGRFRTLDSAAGLSGNIVLSMCLQSDGILYLGYLDGGIDRFTAGRVQPVVLPEIMSGTGILSLGALGNGVVAAGTRGAGMILLNGDNVEIFDRSDGLAADIVWDIVGTESGDIYIGTAGGLSHLSSGKFTTIPLARDADGNHVRCILQTSEDELYIGTLNGLCILTDDEKTRIGIQNGLGSKAVQSLLQGRSGGIFIGTNGGGVSLYYPGRFTTFNTEAGLQGNIVLSIAELKNGDIVAGSYRGGISFVNRAKTFYDNGFLRNTSIPAILETKDGLLLVATEGKGVVGYRGNQRRIIDRSVGLIHNNVTTLYEANDGTVYIGTIEGLTAYKNGRCSTIELPVSSGRIIMDIAESPGGDLYIATLDGGLTILGSGVQRVVRKEDGLAGDRLFAVYPDSSGLIFVGSDHGLSLLSAAGEVLSTIDKTAGLSNNKIHGICRISPDKILVTTNRGLNIITLQGAEPLNIRLLTSRDGLANNECNQGALLHDSRNRIWVGTLEGLTCYRSENDVPNRIPPRVHVTEMHLFDRPVNPRSRDLPMQFTYDENYFKFDYIGIDLNAAANVRYQYRMSGIDRDWINTERRFVQYTNLNPGGYTFEVRAGNEWGYWSDAQALSLNISPPFWHTWWFRLLGTFLVGGLLWGVYRVRLSRLLEIEQLRTRIASDLHDDIGSILTKIAVHSEVIQSHLDQPEKVRTLSQKTGDLSRQVIQMFSDTIWSIDSRNDTMGDLVTRMQEFATRMFDPLDINYLQQLNGIELTHPLSPEIRQNLFFIFKEALHNIARHSGARNVQVLLRHNTRGLLLQISDDGIGGVAGRNSTGQGLQNIAMRVARIDGELTIADESGCRIDIRLPKI